MMTNSKNVVTESPQMRMPLQEKAVFEKLEIELENDDTNGFVEIEDEKLIINPPQK